MNNKTTFKILTILFLALAGATNSTFAQKKTTGKPKSKTAAPRTVYDFYKILPAKYFPFLKRLKDRADFIESDDEKSGYLRFGANVPFPPEHAEMALLNRMNGDFYIVISYTDDDENNGNGVLVFLEYHRGRFTEAEQGASIVDLAEAREIYRRRTGQNADETQKLFYFIQPINKTITVKLGEIEVYKSEWDGNVYVFEPFEN